MIRRFGWQMSVWTIRRWLLATRYWFRHPARCPRLTLEHRRRCREWGRMHRMWDLRQWRHCDESWFSLYHSDGRVRVRRRQGERMIDACVQPNDGNRGPLVMVWGAIHHGGRSELVMLDGTMNRHRYIQPSKHHINGPFVVPVMAINGRNGIWLVTSYLKWPA